MQRTSTRLTFLAAGIAVSAWAALVPFAKSRLDLQSAELGLLLLCLGMGSLIAMPTTGMLAARFGCRPVILWSGAVACMAMPLLAIAPTPILLAFALFAFGAAVGTLDVAMNIQAVIVEREQGGALMSGFHGLYSVGGIVGAGGMALLLWSGSSPLLASAVVASTVAVVLSLATPHLLRMPAEAERDAPAFAVPHGAVILIGALCLLVFMAEGAMLDWSALLLGEGGMTTNQGGVGYAVFAVAMTVGRLTGDRVVGQLGRRRVIWWGSLCTAAGFFIAVLAPTYWVIFLGFALIGSGASNIVPILFTAAGSQKDMSAGMAISAVTTLGYAGILAGPALIGFVAHETGLRVAFAGLGLAMMAVAACARAVT